MENYYCGFNRSDASNLTFPQLWFEELVSEEASDEPGGNATANKTSGPTIVRTSFFDKFGVDGRTATLNPKP